MNVSPILLMMSFQARFKIFWVQGDLYLSVLMIWEVCIKKGGHVMLFYQWFKHKLINWKKCCQD
jgi:hypothetical protein